MFSTTSWIIFGIIAIIVVVVLWKWWNKPETTKAVQGEMINKSLIEEGGDATVGPPSDQLSTFGAPPPPMVFAVNDNGNFDLADMSGKILNIGFGPNPKTYINLLDQSEKDVTKDESTGQMTSNVGTTKLYEVAGRPYIVNFTRL